MVTPYNSSSRSSTSTSKAQAPNPLKRPAELPIQIVSNKIFKGLPQKQTDSSPPIKVSTPLKAYQTRPNLRLHPEPELWFQPPDFETLCRLLFSELDVPLEELCTPKTATDSLTEAELLKAINQLKIRIEKNLSRVSYKDAIYLLHMCDQAKVPPPVSCLELIVSRLSIEDKSQLVRFGFLLPNFFREALKDLLLQDLSHELDPKAKPKFAHWAGYHEILDHILTTCNALIEKPDDLNTEGALSDLNMTFFKETPHETKKSAVEGVKVFCNELLKKLYNGEEVHLPFFYHGTSNANRPIEKIIPKTLLEQEIRSTPELKASYLGAFVSTRIEDCYGPPGIALPFHAIYRPADEVLNFFFPPGQKLQAWIGFKDGIPLRAFDLKGSLVKHEVAFVYNLHSSQEEQLTQLLEQKFPEDPPLLNITEAKLLAGLISQFPLLLPIHFSIIFTKNPNNTEPVSQVVPINPNNLLVSTMQPSQGLSLQSQLTARSTQHPQAALHRQQHAALHAIPPRAKIPQPYPLPPSHPKGTPGVTSHPANALSLPQELTTPGADFQSYIKAFNEYLQTFFLYDLKPRGWDIVMMGNNALISVRPNAPTLDIREQILLRHIISKKELSLPVKNSLGFLLKANKTITDTTALFFAITLLKEKCTKSFYIHPNIASLNVLYFYDLFTLGIGDHTGQFLTLANLEKFISSESKSSITQYLSSKDSLTNFIQNELAPYFSNVLTSNNFTLPYGLVYQEISLKGYKLPPLKILKKNSFHAFFIGEKIVIIDTEPFHTFSSSNEYSSQPFWIKDFQPSFSLDRFFRICKEKPKFARQAIMKGLLTLGIPINPQNSFTPVTDRRRDLITAAKEALPSLNMHFQERHIWSDLSSDYGKPVGYNPELIFNSSSVTTLLYEMMSAVRFYLSYRKDLVHSFNGTFQERIFNLLVYYILNASKPLSAEELLCSIDIDSIKLEIKIDYNTFDEGDAEGRDWRQHPNEPGIAHALFSQLRQEYQIPDSIIMEYLLGAEAPKEHEKPLELFKQFVFEIGSAIHARYFCEFTWGEAHLLPPRPSNEPLIRLLAGDDAEKIEELESYKTFVIRNK